MTRIVGFTGYPYHGKTTCAKALIHVYRYAPMSFAHALKRMLLQLDGVTEDHVFGDLKNEPIPSTGGRTPRYLMETLGTKWGREMIDGEVWINQTKALVVQALQQNKYVVFDDVRFHNEVAMIQAAGGKVFRVTRPHVPVDMSFPASQQIAALTVDAEIENNFPSTGVAPWERLLAHRVFAACRDHGVALDLWAKK